MKTLLAIASVPLLLCAGSTAAATYGPCKFDAQTLRFGGTVAETTACLLRKVRPKGSGADAQTIPSWLLERAARPVDLTAGQLRAYLAREGIAAADLGGAITLGDTPDRRYFVIHDTSSPELSGVLNFPSNIDSPSYSGNNLTGWASLAQRVNLIVSRDGRSRTFRPWEASRALPAVKIEQNNLVPASRKVFVHVENVQPRIKPAGSWAWKAPQPGFSPAQEQRLALAYVVASVRSGRWLIPAYHFNIDQGLPNVHDDPQNVDLASWVAKVAAIAADVAAQEDPR